MGAPLKNASDLIDEGLRLILAKDMLGFADLWAEEGTMELPFAPPGAPRWFEGRAAVREYLRHYTDHLDVRAVHRNAVHVTTDPNVAIAELEVEGVAKETGSDYRMRYIAVVIARDGEIIEYRDYWDPLAAQENTGESAAEATPFPERAGHSA
ncbi:nuclear transport factor 2 family protein [Nocardiopsis sp. NPDC055551]|uniref:nuclear transport factor 2 family protein n=1 Tax=Nocardiopsis sp. NPDC006832 TaxID=3157188 RepID=UPI0033D79DBB